jgi:ATP:corrinoid adenosyltransferase
MHVETPPSDKPFDQAEGERRGLVQVRHAFNAGVPAQRGIED